ncbi:hypothetical protein [Burkholderia gladioli]|nr:hypothetical protein [Burkholderia gladioli]
MAEKLSLYAGQGVGKIHGVVSAAERMAELVAGLSMTREAMAAATVEVKSMASATSVASTDAMAPTLHQPSRPMAYATR